jgi:hypothetical protein
VKFETLSHDDVMVHVPTSDPPQGGTFPQLPPPSPLLPPQPPSSAVITEIRRPMPTFRLLTIVDASVATS